MESEDKKTEEIPQGENKAENETGTSESSAQESEGTIQKRKLEDTAEAEDDHTSKKMKMDEEEMTSKSAEQETESAEQESEHMKKKYPVSEKEEEAETKSSEEQPPASDEEKDKTAEVEKENGVSEPTEDDKQEEQMEVDISPEKEDKPEDKQEEQEKSQSEVKEEEEMMEESDTAQSESKQASKPEKKEKEKVEVVQRRYPTRNRGSGENKTAPDSTKTSGSKSEDEKQEQSDKSGDENNQEYNSANSAASVKSDSGSDKENMNSEGAVDLSNAGTPDVITLSDEEENGERRKQSKAQKAQAKKMVRHLQTQLRNEEAKLVLLKKLRQSQLTPQVQDHAPVPNNSNNQMTKQAVPRQQGGPPPLVRNQQGRSSNLHMQQQQQQNRSSSQSQMRNMQGPPPLVGTPRLGANSANGHGSSQSLRNNTPHINQHGSSNHRPVQQSVQHQQAATPPQPPVDTQTPAQRQAAAKLALRKQLEKTLLQIPPPKPPAPEMNFIPSLACPDFVLLLGLEEVVNHIIDLQLIARGQKSPDEKFICNPFTCVQCGTDYTPVWKREKPGSKNVICEHCVTWNQKRALKQEHTNRLKSAFVKALQQEQEIERMQAQTPSNPSTPTPSGTPPTTASSSAPSQALAAAAAASNVAAAAAMSMNPASFRPSAEQVRQHHSFLQQAHQAQLRAGQPLPGLQGFGARSPFPYNLPYVKQADLQVQRQYLLDMMPRAGMPWKP